jgi:hypothetical protein
MSELVVMPSVDYQAICDAVRAKTGGTDLLKSGDIPSQIEGISGGGEKILYMDAALLNAGGAYPADADDYTTAVIPAEATYVSLDVFENLPNIDTVIINGDCEFETYGDYSPDGKSNLQRNALFRHMLKGKLDKIVINDRAEIPAKFLRDAYGLKTLEIHNCPSVGDYAFYNCYALASVLLQGNADNNGVLGYAMFGYCYSLENIEVGRGYTTFGTYFCNYCSHLRNAVLSEDLSEIGSYCFDLCQSLETITVLCDTAHISSFGRSIGYYVDGGTVYRGHAGSTIEAWATTNGKTFEVIE